MVKKSGPRETQCPALPLPAWSQPLARQLLAWYRRHKRDLPWRATADPYRIWVSEIMLQQTQVATVVPYFQRFVAAFPTVADLAATEEHDVLRHWEGLGYYRRARQMHRAARLIVAEHDGAFPRDFAAVRQLPGIGRYTAGAILSIAFDSRVPILEANTVRLFSRLVAFSGDPATSAGQRFLWNVAETILPRKNCRQFNQALMELGSLLCSPRAPGCDRCPVSDLCGAFQAGKQDRIPPPKAQPRIEAVREAAVVVWHRGKVLLRQRGAEERWAGLWDFLRFPLSTERGLGLRRELLDKICEQSGLAVDVPKRIATLKHGVTRFRITLDCYVAQRDSSKARLARGTWRWVKPADLHEFPLSVTGRKLGRLLMTDQPAARKLSRNPQ